MIKHRKGFAITIDDEKENIFVFGGIGEIGYLSECEKYNLELNEWTEMSSMLQRVHDSSACIMNNETIYIIGEFMN